MHSQLKKPHISILYCLIVIWALICLSSVIYNIFNSKNADLFIAFADCSFEGTSSQELMNAYKNTLLLEHEPEFLVADSLMPTQSQSVDIASQSEITLAKYIVGRHLNIFISPESRVFQNYANLGYLTDLSTVLSSEQLSKYSEHLYYVDKTIISQNIKEHQYLFDTKLNLSSGNKAYCTNPIAVGIRIPKDNPIYNYIGNDSELIISIPNSRIFSEYTISFLEFILG